MLTIILHDKRLFTNTVLLNQIPKNSHNSCQNYCFKPLQQIKGDI